MVYQKTRSMNTTKYNVEVEIVQGDIVEQNDMEAVVNAANAELAPGGGVAGAIHAKAGKGLEKETRQYAPIKSGQAVITDAHGLPNKRVIHTLGPVFGQDEPADKLLAECYRNSLRIAQDEGIESIAFPAISTGAFGYPIDEAAEIAIRTIRDELEGMKNVKRIRIVVNSRQDKDVFDTKFEEIMGVKAQDRDVKDEPGFTQVTPQYNRSFTEGKDNIN